LIGSGGAAPAVDEMELGDISSGDAPAVAIIVDEVELGDATK